MPEYWRIERVATYFDVSANTVRRWIAAGKLQALRAGGTRIPIDEVRRFAAERERKR